MFICEFWFVARDFNSNRNILLYHKMDFNRKLNGILCSIIWLWRKIHGIFQFLSNRELNNNAESVNIGHISAFSSLVIYRTYSSTYISEGCMTNEANDALCILILNWIIYYYFDVWFELHSVCEFNKMMGLIVFNDTIDHLSDV